MSERCSWRVAPPGEIVEAGEYKIPCVSPVPPSDEAFEKLRLGLTEIADRVRQCAPEAKLVFVQYVSLVPEKSCEAATLSEASKKMARDLGLRLASITSDVARETNSLLLEVDMLSRKHTPCDEDPWANGMTGEIDLTKGAPWHPNAKGHAAIADALVRLLQANFPESPADRH